METVWFLHVCKRKFSEIFWNFQRVFLGNFPALSCLEKNISWKSSWLFLLLEKNHSLFILWNKAFYGLQRIFSQKLSGYFMSLISRKFSGTFMFSKNISKKLSGSFMSWKEYFWGTFQYCHASKGIFLGNFSMLFYRWGKEYFHGNFQVLSCLSFSETFQYCHASKGMFLGNISMLFHRWGKEYFRGYFQVLSCFQKNLSQKLSGTFTLWKVYFLETFPSFSLMRKIYEGHSDRNRTSAITLLWNEIIQSFKRQNSSTGDFRLDGAS